MENVRTVATRRTIQGVVVSDKNDKTIVVLVETYKKHPKYSKRVKYGKKYYAHDENNIAKEGDVVTIMETRPLSALKRFRLVSVDKKAVTDDVVINETPVEEVKEAE
jgi:small subunit ribosomal protein S17